MFVLGYGVAYVVRRRAARPPRGELRPRPWPPMGAFCDHSLELTGLAGDTGSWVHRLDPRAKIIGLVAVTLVAVTTPLHAWPVFAVCRWCSRWWPWARAWPGPRSGAGSASSLPLVLLAAIFLPFFRPGGEASTRSAR